MPTRANRPTQEADIPLAQPATPGASQLAQEQDAVTTSSEPVQDLVSLDKVMEVVNSVVHAAVNAAAVTTFNEAVKASTQAATDAIQRSMAPLLKDAHVRQQQDAARLAEVARKEQEVAADKAEQARVQAALPARELQQDSDKRLRGGQQRLQARLEVLDRFRQSSGDITKEELTEIEKVLTMGAQVSPTAALHTRMSVYGMEVEARAERSAPHLYDLIQQHGLAPTTPGSEAQAAILKLFKLQGDKEAKKATAVESYSEYVEFMRKAKVQTRNAHDKDPESFWQMLWHSQSVQHLYTEWGWETALEYHRMTMEAWQEGFLDLPSMVDTEECRRGDVGGAMHQRFFHTALQVTGAKPKNPRKAGAGGAAGGTKWCSFCKLTTHDTVDCRKKAAKEAKAKWGKP